jgi:hypothetical protein
MGGWSLSRSLNASEDTRRLLYIVGTSGASSASSGTMIPLNRG